MKRNPPKPVLLAVLAFSLTLETVYAQAHHQSGIIGQAFVSSSYCVQLGPPPRPCPDARPISATILVYSEGGELVAKIETDEDGFFEVNLKPGNYAVAPYIPPPPPGSGSVGRVEAFWTSVTVKKKEFTHAWVLYVFLPL